MKRFYDAVSVEQADTGYVITLDGRPVKTPAKKLMAIPAKALADAIAKEWEEQDEKVLPETMPLTQLVTTAIDRVMTQFDAVVDELAGFGASDLLCYREEEQRPLKERQKDVWDPYLAWAKDALDAELVATGGIMPVSQPDEALAALRGHIAGLNAYELTGLHALTTGFGSLVLGLAHLKGFSPLESTWQAAILDESYQIQLWGQDEEAETKLNNLYKDVLAASEFLALLKP